MQNEKRRGDSRRCDRQPLPYRNYGLSVREVLRVEAESFVDSPSREPNSTSYPIRIFFVKPRHILFRYPQVIGCGGVAALEEAIAGILDSLRQLCFGEYMAKPDGFLAEGYAALVLRIYLIREML